MILSLYLSRSENIFSNSKIRIYMKEEEKENKKTEKVVSATGMAITKEEVKNLADLVRIQINDDDAQSLAKDMDSILSYVSDVEKLAVDVDREIPKVRNVFREDEVTNAPGEYKESLLNNAPQRDGDYLVVKKIL